MNIRRQSSRQQHCQWLLLALLGALLTLSVNCYDFQQTITRDGDRYIVTAPDWSEFDNAVNHRAKRAAVSGNQTAANSSIITKINHLNDSHKQLMVHWVGERSKVVICLARDPEHYLDHNQNQKMGPSAVFISYDYGDTYENKTDSFKLKNGSYSIIVKFYNHPQYNTHFVFTDVANQAIFVTTDHGKTFTRYDLDFAPSEISFADFEPNIFAVLDKSNISEQKLYLTENFGKDFRLAQIYVRSIHWMRLWAKSLLIVQRVENKNSTTIIYSRDNYRTTNLWQSTYANDVRDIYFKGDYIFTTKMENGLLQLYVSHKVDKPVLCKFDTIIPFKEYLIVDVTSDRALVVGAHGNDSAVLYVSDSLADLNDHIVKFTISLPNVFAYFPQSTWQNSWIKMVSNEAFADVYKVEGMTGIYIASRVISKPPYHNIGPQHLVSVITFDHGAIWRPIQAPAFDVEGQSTACQPAMNCSLHLCQKFSSLHPDGRSNGILTSKSAPGVIMATGIIGKSLKGHYGVYISVDAGQTWRQSLRDLYFFNMGDHGGVMTAVKFYKNKGETKEILYSINEGENWNSSVFDERNMIMYGLMTEPGENTTVFTMFGSLPDRHQWVIIKIDFWQVFKSFCTKSDYKMWSPSQSDANRNYIPCVLGEQITYERRMPHAACLNGLEYVQVVRKGVCECDYVDFECDFGFKRVSNRCILDKSTNYDPFKIPESCRPRVYYNRTKGYRKIAGDKCMNGFADQYLPDFVPCPIDSREDFLLFAQREKISRLNLVSGTIEELPVTGLKNVIAIDFDLKNNCVLYSDIALDTIGRQCFAGNKSEVLVSTNLHSIEGMAFDWISRTLYFVDGTRARIELIRTDVNHAGRMRRTILDDKILKKPRGITVHPLAGYLYWTDWSTENPSINRANLDGSNYKQLFGRPKVEWPNGVAIDYIANRVFWVDARLDYIGSCDLHGEAFQKIVSNAEVVSHPFAVAIFKHHMYWDDWKRNAIFRADKDQFYGFEVMLNQSATGSGGLMDLKVFGHGVQIGDNTCATAGCKYICVGMPKNKFQCLCPDGFVMDKSGRCLCEGGGEPDDKMRCNKKGANCAEGYFSCGNAKCIPKGWECDGVDDCGDNSDEEQHCRKQTCAANFHMCGDGKCIPNYWRCDYDKDCSDGSDELNCPKNNCTEHQFTCQNGRCISNKWKCDGENDCRDGSDELNCPNNAPSTCKSDEFHCHSGNVHCIPSTWKCDGEPDCTDNSDEQKCISNNCSENLFSCGPPSHRCIYSQWVCDGDEDCKGGADEVNCTTTKPFEPIQPPIDDIIPQEGACQDWMFNCTNKRCIPFWWRCDGADDCGDGSDELGCPSHGDNHHDISNKNDSSNSDSSGVKPLTCNRNQYQCLDGKCIMMAWLCDGKPDCANGDDEKDCEGVLNCTLDQFECVRDGSCISKHKVCDSIADCPDKSDEESCQSVYSTVAPPSCPRGFYHCDSADCHPLHTFCDGNHDCIDNYDESNCSPASRYYQVRKFGIDQKYTTNSTVTVYWWLPVLSDEDFEFLPSYAPSGTDRWRNTTWTSTPNYTIRNLQPYMHYNITVYIRIKDKPQTVYVPAHYIEAETLDGTPSAPYNVTARQENGSHILISWNKPVQPNGKIVGYYLCWTPKQSREVKLRLGEETSHLLTADLQHDSVHSFHVIAINEHYESPPSATATVNFREQLIQITNLTAKPLAKDNQVEISWTYNRSDVQFTVTIDTPSNYPQIQPKVTNEKSVTMQLAPGALYRIQVQPTKDGYVSTPTEIRFKAPGEQLPLISQLDGILVKDAGNVVKLSWQRPKTGNYNKVNWKYGVYYGIDKEHLFEKARLETPNLTATIPNLEHCETYDIRVGVVGPYGVGPLPSAGVQLTTMPSIKARSKLVDAKPLPEDPYKLVVTWQPPCLPHLIDHPTGYIIYINDTVLNKTSNIFVNGPQLSHTFQIRPGAIYRIQVAVAAPDALRSEPALLYHAPAIQPPREIRIIPESNGSYYLYWLEAELPPSAGSVQYEILVSDGSQLNEAEAQRFIVNRPPFVYTNFSAPIYTFAMRVRTKTGHGSPLSEQLSRRVEVYTGAAASQSAGGMSAVVITSILVILALIGAVAFLVIRNRRLHSSFTRFSNSHYDTRSEAATFDDNGLEEDNQPQIRGFSDDEPLVIA